MEPDGTNLKNFEDKISKKLWKQKKKKSAK